jgi:phosphoribosylanthranilate isomerase
MGAAENTYSPQIKICGLTDVDQAMACAKLGADAIGLVFYPQSPRFVTDPRAKEICRALPKALHKVGVFVDEPYETIRHKVDVCGLTGVQLHGHEPTELVRQLGAKKILVIKALFADAEPSFKQAGTYAADAFLVEYGRGVLPGGNAQAWQWDRAETLGDQYPLILAGGLSAENVAQAMSSCRPDAVDASSSLESIPGQKDLDKVAQFISAVAQAARVVSPGSRSAKQVF